ncbi:hypothetical protein [Azospirillum doebereinerae]|uniref:hypothetical protein n=1 Tax=Azospirillum doebereinerae TaxID=92933 RepID=UPI00163C9E3A|nr:hypothetical protein [Azospirillum doebereinerae]
MLINGALSLCPPVVGFDPIHIDDLNRCLVAWGHKMGPWTRPDFGDQWLFGIRHDGRLVAVTASCALMTPRCAAGLTRADAFELGRVCAVAPDWCRVAVRLWRLAVYPAICSARGYQWGISYQDALRHSGDLYRHDGWRRIAFARGGGSTDQRTGRKGFDKWIWGWHPDPEILKARELPRATIDAIQARLKRRMEASRAA